MGVESILAPFMRQAVLCMAVIGLGIRLCRDESAGLIN